MKTRPLYFQPGGFTSFSVEESGCPPLPLHRLTEPAGLLLEDLMQLYQFPVPDLIFAQRIFAAGPVEVDHGALWILKRWLII